MQYRLRMLLEREGELATLRGLIDDLGAAGGKVVLIRGEAGIGKSALVEAFAAARSVDCRVLLGTCDDLYIPQPLTPFVDIGRTEPTLAEPLDEGDRSRAFEAALGLLSRSGRPNIMIIEDTHWADEATLDAIRYLGRRIARTNGLLLLTYRDGDVDYNHPLRGVIGDIPAPTMARIHLGGLSLSGVASILEGSSLDASEVLSATGGNPFMVTEVMSAADDRVPASLNDSVMARVRKLTIGSQEMLKLFSVIPESIDTPVALGLVSVDAGRLDECEQRGLLVCDARHVRFRHDLIRRTVESAMSASERLAKNRQALATLPRDTHPCLLVHCAAEAQDIDTLLDVAPRSARWAIAMRSRKQAIEDLRQVGPYLDRYSPERLGPLLDEWAELAYVIDDMAEAIRINELARAHYRQTGDRRAESRTLTRLARCHESAGRRERAETLAREAVEILGDDADGADLAVALEVNAYLQMMAGNVSAVPELVRRTLAAGGPDIDEEVLICSLNHRGVVANITGYPEGKASHDEARALAEVKGYWYEESRALLLQAWAAAEFRDLSVASDYARRAVASAVRHDLPSLETYAKALQARVLDFLGRWDEAADLARELSDAAAISQMVSLPILGAIEARKGRPAASEMLSQALELASVTGEFQRMAPAGIACAEYRWISGEEVVPVEELQRVMANGIELGFEWSSGAIAFWLWKLGALASPPAGIVEPYRLLIEGQAREAADIFEVHGIPYEQALALSHGDEREQLEALEQFEALGASAVAAKVRQQMRAQGISVTRGKGRTTRRHVAGLTARQAEVLGLLAEDLTNTEIADRLFVSPRTVENHVAAVLDKLDVSSRADAVEQARSSALL
jgi:DNA-binding CsgD family transcriptional regulator